MEMKKFILDTSIFTNPDVYIQFGSTVDEAAAHFFQKALVLGNCSFFMPPSVYQELEHFVSQGLMGRLFTVVEQKSPKKHELKVPAILLYEMIADIRDRIDKGLRVAEEIIRSTDQENMEDNIAQLRKKYRRALREGIVDSIEDLEIILLALEMDGTIVSADEGIIKLAQQLGVRFFESRKFGEVLDLLIKSSN